MSTAQKATMIKLQSQTQILDKLRLMTRFGSNLVTFIGSRGAGKSLLLEQYHTQYVATPYKAKLLGDASTSVNSLKRDVLQQLLPKTPFVAERSLFDHLDNELGLQAAEIVVLIDDAHLLSSEVIVLLWQWVERIQAHPMWSINLILACSSELLPNTIQPLSHQFNVQPVQLNIDPLSPRDAEFFLELMVLRKFESVKKRDKIRKKARRLVSYPGEIMALGNKVNSRKPVLPSNNGSAKYGIVITLLIVIILLGLWQVISNTQPENDADVAHLSEPAQDVTLTPDELQSSKVADFSVIEKETLTEDTVALPPAVTTTTVTIDDGSKGRERAVLPDELVDSLIDSDSQVRKPTASTEVSTSPLSEPSAPVIHFSFSRSALMAVSRDRYTIQLGALRTMAEVQSFLDTHHMQDKVRIYPTIRAEKKWYIITYKDFRYVKQASQAIEQLPTSVQSVGPWVKSMARVHQEIEVAK
ncbi:SPOR domain-containing protein [Vibrio rarus]|uniref:SPOR domain-containing protein n=1 Tax=Vibrio rarus TaxID=413403 RepID=UPI0021C48AF5|nr:AAA family ATPase [Vibrio rarus]